MEEPKKRKVEELDVCDSSSLPSEKTLRSLLEPLSKSQLIDFLAKIGSQYASIAEEIKSIASADPVNRKLFVRGLSWNTTSESLCAAFRVHGEIEEGAVITDKNSGKSRGYGFITYKDIESTREALRATSKLIDGRMAVCNLACEGLNGSSITYDVMQRKLYVGGLSPTVTTEMLLNFFGSHGDIEEASVAYDKDTNESRGFGFVTYKSVEAAKRAVNDPRKIIGGRNVMVKLADSHKTRVGQQQSQVGTGLLPLSQTGGTHTTNPAIGYTYAPSPSGYPYGNSSGSYVSLHQSPYAAVTLNKDQMALPRAPSLAHYPYYLSKS